MASAQSVFTCLDLGRFVGGALSGWTAATVALPFDYVKTMLQKQKPDAAGKLEYAVSEQHHDILS